MGHHGPVVKITTYMVLLFMYSTGTEVCVFKEKLVNSMVALMGMGLHKSMELP